MAKQIPSATVARLPLYARALLSLSSRGVTVTSSQMLASESHTNAAQVRKDLSYMGAFGTRGLGYDVKYLLSQINRYLGLDRNWTVALAGFGQLGHALVGYKGFSERGFSIVAIYDADPGIVGTDFNSVKVEDSRKMSDSLADKPVDIGIIATPAGVAQEVADAYVRGGVKSILNFAPTVIRVPPDVSVRNVDLSIELQVLSFYHSSKVGS